jgi:hypothetical protein
LSPTGAAFGDEESTNIDLKIDPTLTHKAQCLMVLRRLNPNSYVQVFVQVNSDASLLRHERRRKHEKKEDAPAE